MKNKKRNGTKIRKGRVAEGAEGGRDGRRKQAGGEGGTEQERCTHEQDA
jgi:hypothetical protein